MSYQPGRKSKDESSRSPEEPKTIQEATQIRIKEHDELTISLDRARKRYLQLHVKSQRLWVNAMPAIEAEARSKQRQTDAELLVGSVLARIPMSKPPAQHSPSNAQSASQTMHRLMYALRALCEAQDDVKNDSKLGSCLDGKTPEKLESGEKALMDNLVNARKGVQSALASLLRPGGHGNASAPPELEVFNDLYKALRHAWTVQGGHVEMSERAKTSLEAIAEVEKEEDEVIRELTDLEMDLDRLREEILEAKVKFSSSQMEKLMCALDSCRCEDQWCRRMLESRRGYV